MDECKDVLDTGLRGVVVASTKISDVNGAEGKLIYRGYLAKELAGESSFEEVTHLLLFERLPNHKELEHFDAALKKERYLPPEVINALQLMPHNALPMDVLQSSVAMLAQFDPDIRERSKEATQRMAIRLISKIPLIVAVWERIRNNKNIIEPDNSLGHAANFLYMLNGEKPDNDITSFFDTALLLHAEHSFNASTFSARQVASTRAHIYTSIAAAIGSLSGELHGGANTRVMEMLQKIGNVDAVDDFVNDVLEKGGKIMGLGHAVYQVDDPRAHILAPMSKIMGDRASNPKWYELSKQLELKGKEAFKERKGKDIFVNVDFYSASLYYYMGIPMDLFTPVFALSRISGWAAHVLEEQFAEAAPKPVLYRPESEYIGEYCGPDECSFEPINERDEPTE